MSASHRGLLTQTSSDFPSLSGAPQAQHQNPGQAVWAQRPTQQQSQTQRQNQDTQQPSQSNQRSAQHQPQSSTEDTFPIGSQFSNGLEDFRSRGQGLGDQAQNSSQPPPSSIEEFPPLGRDTSTATGNREVPSEIGPERRSSIIQNTGFGAYTNGMAFAGMSQQRNPLASSNPLNRSQEQSRITSPSGQGLGCKLTPQSKSLTKLTITQLYRHQGHLCLKDRMAQSDKTSQ